MSKVYQIFADSPANYICSNNPVLILQYLGTSIILLTKFKVLTFNYLLKKYFCYFTGT